MGHREDLLAGAMLCLAEKGYARTTARDIVAASGTNLASIGYHFGSKETLLNAALIQATEEWGDELERALAADFDPHAGPIERFEATWTRVVELFATHRSLWAGHFESLAQIERVPEVRQFFAEAQSRGREALAALFLNIDPEADDESARVVGSFCHALLAGVMMQWLTDPQTAPSGGDLAKALRIIAAGAAVTR